MTRPSSSTSVSSFLPQRDRQIDRTMVIHIIKLILTYIFFPLLSSILTVSFPSFLIKIYQAFILSWKYEFINVIIVEIINIYCILKLRIILHPKSYSGFFRINQQIMNSTLKSFLSHFQTNTRISNSIPRYRTLPSLLLLRPYIRILKIHRLHCFIDDLQVLIIKVIMSFNPLIILMIKPCLLVALVVLFQIKRIH